MAKIGLIDVDGTGTFPNLALMKISAWHKAHGDNVGWYSPFEGLYDVVYMSKVFSFTPDFDDAINAKIVYRGGQVTALNWWMVKKFSIRKETLTCQMK